MASQWYDAVADEIRHPGELLAALDGASFHRGSPGPASHPRLQRLTPSADLGSGHLDYVEFGDDFVAIFPRLSMTRRFPVRFADSGWVRMHFRLGGHNTTYFDRSPREMSGAFCNILRLPEGMVATELHSDRQIGWVTVFSRAEFLRREFGLERVALPRPVEHALGERAPALVLETSRLPAPAWRMLSDVGPLAAGGPLGFVRCEAVVTELVCLLFESFAARPSGVLSQAGAAQVERCRQARQLIHDNIADPPSIEALARAVGTNRTTLSRGFRTVFGHSVFEVIQEERMTRAAELLADPAVTVTSVADRLGYASVAGFSHAFKQHFGVPPGTGRRPRTG